MSQGGGFDDLPADIRLPSRRTARDSSPRFQSELAGIKSELRAMQDDLGKEITAENAQNDLEDEVSTLYHELQRAASKLEQEKAQRKKIEAELEALRSHRLRETSDVVQQLEQKRTELNTLREERQMMKEWLDRGVSECKRVADEVIRLKQDLETSERSCAQLQKEKQRLATTIQQLSEELSAVQVTLEKVHHDKSVLDLRAEEATTMLARAEDQRRTSMQESDSLSAEVVRLSQRVRGLEDAEVSMQSMCACIDQLAAEVASLERNIQDGDLEASIPQNAADAANDIGEPKSLSTMVIEAKRLLQHLQDSCAKLRVSVKRFIAEKQKNFADMSQIQGFELNNLQQQKNQLIRQHETEKQQLERRVMDLEREIVNVAEGVSRDMQHEANERLAALDQLSRTNRDLNEANQRVREENDKLRVKAKKMKIDWSKVDESRRRYQQLQAEVKIMNEYNDRLQMENRNLKLMVEGTSGMGSPMSPSAAAAASGGAATIGDISHMQNIHRNAFEEWKNTTIRGSTVHPY